MFTGIISEVGTIAATSSRAKSRDLVSATLTIRAPKIARRLRLGSSIAVNGVCTTVEDIIPSSSSRVSSFLSSRAKSRDLAFTIRLMPVTLKLTTLGGLKIGDRVNLEPSLRVGDELGGHFIYGHIDGIGMIASSRSSSRVKSRDLATLVSIKVPSSLTRFIVPRGSIAVDGVSLTVVARRANVFTVSLVDYTVKRTTLGMKRFGDKVNIEIDALARYTLQ